MIQVIYRGNMSSLNFIILRAKKLSQSTNTHLYEDNATLRLLVWETGGKARGLTA